MFSDLAFRFEPVSSFYETLKITQFGVNLAVFIADIKSSFVYSRVVTDENFVQNLLASFVGCYYKTCCENLMEQYNFAAVS